MNRCLAFIAAVILAFLSVSSACTAAPTEMIHFTLEPERGSDLIHASFRKDEGRHNQNNWSTGFPASDFVGLDLAGFRGAGSRPISFAVNREAGRLDCTGHGGESYAAGYCSFTPSAAFAQLLESRGIGRPSQEQAFALMSVDARRELIDALAAARYPTPTIDKLIPLAALGVNRAYISGMERAGYRPGNLDTLVQFKALDITPEWIGTVARMGYANLPGNELVQLKALDITPEFIAAFDRIGYGHLSAGELVQLKALNITPEFIAGFDRIGFRHLPIDQLVQLKALDITPEFVQRVAGSDNAMPSIGELVQLKSMSTRH